jgi:hypothetical protein
MSKPIDKQQLLAQMASQVTKFAASENVARALKPFDDDIVEDPLFTWSVMDKCDYEPSTLILLNNWSNDEGSNNTVAWNVDCTRGYFNHTLEITDETFNRTFDQLFNTPWSRERIDSRHCLIGNAVPGLWRNKKVEGQLDKNVYDQGLDLLWLPIMEDYHPSDIYLCGEWARTLARSVRAKLPNSAFQVTVLCHPAARGHRFWNGPEGPDTLEEW